MFASLAGTTDFVAVKVEFATGDGFSFPFGHFGVFSWRSSQISLALTEKRSMRDGYGSQQAELTCSPCSRDVTAAIDWPCPPPLAKPAGEGECSLHWLEQLILWL